MSRTRATRRQRAVMASDAEWALVTERAGRAGMELSRYVVHACTRPQALPATLLRRMVREVLLLSRLEQVRWEDLGAMGRWRELADAVDDWLEREETVAHLTEAGAPASGDTLGAMPESPAPGGQAKTRGPRS